MEAKVGIENVDITGFFSAFYAMSFGMYPKPYPAALVPSFRVIILTLSFSQTIAHLFFAYRRSYIASSIPWKARNVLENDCGLERCVRNPNSCRRCQDGGHS